MRQIRATRFLFYVPLVLVIDPDLRALGGLCTDLGRLGFQTMASADVDDALARAREHPPDLVITELWFPQGGGLSVIERWRAAGLPGLLLVVTGNASFELAVAALRLGAAHVLTKPVSAGEILAAARDAAGNAATRGSARPLTIAEATEVYLRTLRPGSAAWQEANRQLDPDRLTTVWMSPRRSWAPRTR